MARDDSPRRLERWFRFAVPMTVVVGVVAYVVITIGIGQYLEDYCYRLPESTIQSARLTNLTTVECHYVDSGRVAWEDHRPLRYGATVIAVASAIIAILWIKVLYHWRNASATTRQVAASHKTGAP